MSNISKAIILLWAMSAFLYGCGGSGGSAGVSPSSAPVISELVVSYGSACIAPNGQPGRVLSVQLGYADNEDIDGSHLDMTVLFTGTGQTGDDSWRIAQDASLVTGNTGAFTSGIIQVSTCLRSASPVRLTFTLTDENLNTSNALTGELPATHS